MAGELLRPGVSVLQTTRNATPSFTRPTLVPCIIGPAFEVVNVLNSDASINSKAKWGEYAQLGISIPQLGFPDARGNIDEVNVLEGSIRPFLLSGGELQELPLGPGESFLVSSHKATRAGIKTKDLGGTSVAGLGGKVLVLSFDNPTESDTSRDVTVVFGGASGAARTLDDIVADINGQVGQSVATKVGQVIRIVSTVWGARSSVTVRSGGSANSLLELGYDTTGTAQRDERVEGSGWAAEDDKDNDTVSPWVKFFPGALKVNGVVAALTKGFFVPLSGADLAAAQSPVEFGSPAPKLDVRVGDKLYADGLLVGEVMKVEAARLKLGQVNPALSTADEKGRYTQKVYDAVEVATLLDAAAFSPKYVYLRASGLDHKKLAPTPASLTGVTQGTAATAATLQSTTAVQDQNFNLTGLYLDYEVTVDGVVSEGRFTFTDGYVDLAAVLVALGSNIPGVVATKVITDATPTPDLVKLKLDTAKTGARQGLLLKGSSTALSALGFAAATDVSSVGSDVTFTGLTGKVLEFVLDGSAHTYQVTLTSDSLADAIAEVNAAVGASVASEDVRKLRLTSTLKGVASSVKVVDGGAADPLGLEVADTPVSVVGAGRPLPDAFLDDTGALVVGAQLLRDQVTGAPLDQALNKGSLYIQFKGLRRDVSPVAKQAGVLRIPDPDTLSSVLSPISEENPLGLGLFLAMLNAPGFEVKGLGVDEVTGAAPQGTPLAYARAASLLETEEVYALAPLTSDEVVEGLWHGHVRTMSEPDAQGERILLFNRLNPERKNPTVAASGTQGNSTATPNQLLLDTNPVPGLVEAGLNPADPFSVAHDVYLELEVTGELRRYSVSGVTGALVNLRNTFLPSQNKDGFFSTLPLSETVVNSPWALKVRGASLAIPGSSPERPDYSLMSEVVAEANSAMQNRRAFSLFPDSVKSTIDGIEKALPGYYACAAYAGLIASVPPQQGLTNYPVAGITGVVGTEKFTKKQLDKMAGGGTFILIQDVVGGPVVARQQVSTDTRSIEARELSVTKVVDFTAKFLRQAVRKFIGTSVINASLLDNLGTTTQGVLDFLVEMGVLNGGNLNNLLQDENAPDTVLIDVTLAVPFPCNYIRLTLVV